MFGKRTSFGGNPPSVTEPARPAPVAARTERVPVPVPLKTGADAAAGKLRNEDVIDVRSPEAAARDKEYHQTKSAIFNALIDSIDLSQLATMDQEAAREEIRDIVAEIIALKSIIMSISEQEDLLEDICNDVLGYGPLEPLLARDDISDIMVNGSQKCYIEVAGRVKLVELFVCEPLCKSAESLRVLASLQNSGVETWKSSRRLAWPARRIGPNARVSSRPSARANSMTRAFSVTTWRAMGSSAT